MTEKREFIIRENRKIASGTFSLMLEAAEGGFTFSGEFVDIALDGFYLRRPISVCDAWPGGMRLIYKTVGKGTEALCHMAEGRRLDVLTGLGKGFNPDACHGEALLLGGGLGCAPLLPLCKKLKEKNRKIRVIIGFNRSDEVILEDEFRSLAEHLTIATMDGGKGVEGTVLDALGDAGTSADFFYCCGPLVMMKAVCTSLPIPGEVSLEERMGCGAGFCYGCSCRTLTGTRRICTDGPVFRKEEVIWQ